MAERPVSIGDELARERNREAADRTLLAWIRTSLAMISLGFGIERFGQAALSFDGETFSPIKTRIFGASLIVLGVAATLAGMWEHRIVLAAVADPDYRYRERPAIARAMALAIIVIGMAAFVTIVSGY